MRLSTAAACLFGATLFTACSASRDDGGAADALNGDEASASRAFGNNEGTPATAPAPKACQPNPANYDIPGNQCDDDGDGTVDNPPPCDADAFESGDAEAFARAIGICTKARDKGYGLVSAKFTRGYGRSDAPANEQHGILKKFGDVIRPREGAALGVLSSGYAREYDGHAGAPFGGTTTTPTWTGTIIAPNGKDWFDAADQPGTGSAPPGFPKGAAGCNVANVVNDVISLKLELKAPRNAAGVQFDFNFYSGEWPAFICSAFNDSFVAYLTAKGFNDGKPDNISFDKQNNPVSVNNLFFDRCTPNIETGCAPQSQPGMSTCPGGVSELAGTGFGLEQSACAYDPSSAAKATAGGATGWLTSHAPVQPGETFTLEFMIWDTGDGMLDSSVLLDRFTWLEGQAPAATERPIK